MTSSSELDQVRRTLGPVGVFLGVFDDPPTVDEQREGVRRMESAGYRAVWTNEIVGADALVRASIWLAATENMVVGTGIANMQVRAPQTADAAAAQLAQAFPGRFVLGLGVGHPDQAKQLGHEFASPLATARSYLTALSDSYPRLLGANGPKMLALAGELADGALPAGAPPEATSAARRTLGPDKLLVVFVPMQASDGPDGVPGMVTAHLEAGADHVILGRSFDRDFAASIDGFEALAPTLARFSPA